MSIFCFLPKHGVCTDLSIYMYRCACMCIYIYIRDRWFDKGQHDRDAKGLGPLPNLAYLEYRLTRSPLFRRPLRPRGALSSSPPGSGSPLMGSKSWAWVPPWGPQRHHLNIRIRHSGSMARDEADSRNHGFLHAIYHKSRNMHYLLYIMSYILPLTTKTVISVGP